MTIQPWKVKYCIPYGKLKTLHTMQYYLNIQKSHIQTMVRSVLYINEITGDEYRSQYKRATTDQNKSFSILHFSCEIQNSDWSPKWNTSTQKNNKKYTHQNVLHTKKVLITFLGDVHYCLKRDMAHTNFTTRKVLPIVPAIHP